jgi:hypothetical protein
VGALLQAARNKTAGALLLAHIDVNDPREASRR